MTEPNETEDLFDDAQEEFPAKEDLKDRLVAIWVTGKHGMRKSPAVGSRPYAWYETVTLVLDDGPNWDGTKIVDDERKPMLVPSVAEDGPQRLDGLQYSQGGLTSRLSARVHVSPTPPVVNGPDVFDKPKSFRPMLGRINSKKNKQAGFNPSWSIAEPTAEDKIIARKYNDQLAKITKELETAASAPVATDEFDD